MIDINNCFTYAYSAGTVDDYFQSLTADAASTNYVDLDAANLDIASGRPIFLIVRVGTVFNTLTSLEIRLDTDTDSGFATALKNVAIWNVALASLVAGAVVVNQALPIQLYQRYIHLYFNVVGSNPSTGSLFAHLSDAPEKAFSQLDLVGA